jgi:hypothetical protein
LHVKRYGDLVPWQAAEKHLTGGVAAILYRQTGDRINPAVAT